MKTTMDYTTDSKKIEQLEGEAKQLQQRIKEDIESNIRELFYEYGFVKDPRDINDRDLDRAFFHPETKISIWFGGVLKNDVRFSVHLRDEEGINWGLKNNLPGYTNWKYKKESFDEFFNGTFGIRVKKT